MAVLTRLPLALVMLAALCAAPVSAAGAVAADVCLEVRPDAMDIDGWPALTAAVEAVVRSHTSLFPDPTIAASPFRLDIASGHAGLETGTAACLEPEYAWTARFGRRFLEATADRMLAEAPTTPGIASEVSLEWFPSETRVRTTLAFAGPFDIPNGTCWVDDHLTLDAASGSVNASGEQGLETSPFAEAACRRFFDHLPDGGAGEQAVTLLPASVEWGDGQTLRFIAERVSVGDDAIIVSGSVERERP